MYSGKMIPWTQREPSLDYDPKGVINVEDEISHFADYFAYRGQSKQSPVQEAVLDLHDEALHQLTDIARALQITGSNEFMRSVALQLCIEQFADHAQTNRDITSELHFSAGDYKPRALCVFKDTLDQLSALERDLRCSETILIESAIRYATEASSVALA